MPDRDSILKEFTSQYAHTWRVFTRLVKDFDDEAWLQTGRNAMTPARLSFHILKAVKYYIEDRTDMDFASGKAFDMDSTTAREDDLPLKSDILTCIEYLSEAVEDWLKEIDYHAVNENFPWAGEAKAGVVLFLLRHTTYHLGELSALLNESRCGNVEDHYVSALDDLSN